MKKEDKFVLLWKYVGAYLAIAFPIIIFILCSVASRRVCINYNGFSVDEKGNVYIGKMGEIYVIDSSGSSLDTFDVPTSRGYSFVVTKNNRILLRAGEIVFTMDLQGNIIKREPTSERFIERIPTICPKEIIAADGTVYRMETHFLRTVIQVQTGNKINQIYQMPLYDYIVTLLFTLIVVGSIVYISIIVFRIRHVLKN